MFFCRRFFLSTVFFFFEDGVFLLDDDFFFGRGCFFFERGCFPFFLTRVFVFVGRGCLFFYEGVFLPLHVSCVFHGSFAATTASNSACATICSARPSVRSLQQHLGAAFDRKLHACVARPKMTAPYTALPPGAVSQKPSVKMMTGCRD